MIRLATDDIRQTLNTAQPDVIAVGPGLGKSPLAIQCLGATLSYSNIPLVIDADALNLISESTELLEKLQVRNQAPMPVELVS
jgi:NAD(P)H-hydrate repair Nnr-like enzyme with NAD(P)H-hydrate dehydratase domain